MWLKLTLFDDRLIRVNMAYIDFYYDELDEDRKPTGMRVVEKDGQCNVVKETCEQIDDALSNPDSPLRLVKGW